MKYRVLVVEDQSDIRTAIQAFITRSGYDVVSVATGEEAWESFQTEEFHVILTDMMLPGLSGEELIKKIRAESDIPIIVISALTDEMFQINAYEYKIDDYVSKPFSMNILIYKIEAIIRRTYTEALTEIEYKDIRLIVNNYEVFYHGELVDLTAKEFELLQTLLLGKGKIYTREELIDLIWGYDYLGDTRTIDMHIKNIRKKLFPELIATVKGVGYRIERN
ncbi:two-component response regulator VanRB [Listeria floridensis FSL S10-1187]|uniref:Two-component response regulator VanRB n=1 Tax=Listeria floridensis FSL S10-1187 TaxID=1265817 RepID=A0ABP3AWQ2_9LIST|nr:response regulator transcription factor [Listeria floridensis]EUJ28478.1 two-component response regulator VanRB [Listeria floridensis FSL S10-1187]